MMPSPAHAVIPFDLNPYKYDTPSPELSREAAELARTLAAREADILIAATYRPTWLEYYLAARLKSPRTIGVVSGPPPGGLLAVLLKEFDLESPVFETPDDLEFVHEKARYAALAALLPAAPKTAPKWNLTATQTGARDAWLQKLDLKESGYLVCFPFGAVPEKCWPEERFLEVLQTVCSEFRLSPLLIGARGEQDGIARMQRGMACARTFTGDADDLPLLAALLASCRAWVGNDTGPMHLAQAFHKPGVAIFGGGAGRAYSPWAGGAIGFIHPLPCFGCMWDCAFGHGLCVDSIPAPAVLEALARAVIEPAPLPEMRELNLQPEPLVRVIGQAAGRYREAQASRKRRLELLVELKHEADQRLERLEESVRRGEDLAASAAERERAVLELDAALQASQATLEEKQAALEQRDLELAALRAECDRLAAHQNPPAHLGPIDQTAEKQE
jgi:ADP-heptose:LPS heptosyltransferase